MLLLPAIGPLLRRFEEACRVVQALRDEPLADLDGEFDQLRSAPMEPEPVGPMPLFSALQGERVMPGIVARQAQGWNVRGTPERLARKNAVLTADSEREGRDPSTLWRTTQAEIILGNAFRPTPILVTSGPSAARSSRG